jgi:RES domain-containing protein
MLVFRIERERYLDNAMSGRGASLSSGNRWNGFGTRMVYTSESRALALLEIMVHLDVSEDLPADRILLEIEIPDAVGVYKPAMEDLPMGWGEIPVGRDSQLFGDRFTQHGEAAVMRVPSTLVPGEYNYVLNPQHGSAGEIRIVGRRPIVFDTRFGRLVEL